MFSDTTHQCDATMTMTQSSGHCTDMSRNTGVETKPRIWVTGMDIEE
jgi:hypothetical protein